MIYRVYAVIYQSPSRDEGLCAVAVSASSPKAARARLMGNRPAKIIHVELIEGRQAEWAQDRIEGTMDLADPMKHAPFPSDEAAADMRRRNKDIIRRRFPEFSGN